MIKRLENALLMAMHDHRTEVQKEDFLLLPSQEMQSKCHVGNKYHRIEGFSLACSCSLPSSNGIVWRWPENDCRDVLQPGAGRRIIRRLAYKAGIVEMTSDLLELAEAELLHTLGILLVEAYESSVEITKAVRFLDPKQALTYGSCAGPMDMFYTPPPPFNESPSHDDRKQPVYTIVPGQISAAAEKRGIGPSKVYSHYFSVSSPSADEEMLAEKEYYYEDGYFEDCEPKPGTCDCNCMFECSAVEVEEGGDAKSKDIDLIMRVTGYSRVNAVKALKENDNDKGKVFNDYVARQLDSYDGQFPVARDRG
jgi:NACalpha-BTF3-like transcription factor